MSELSSSRDQCRQPAWDNFEVELVLFCRMATRTRRKRKESSYGADHSTDLSLNYSRLVVVVVGITIVASVSILPRGQRRISILFLMTISLRAVSRSIASIVGVYNERPVSQVPTTFRNRVEARRKNLQREAACETGIRLSAYRDILGSQIFFPCTLRCGSKKKGTQQRGKRES